jgi:hypothetical protein
MKPFKNAQWTLNQTPEPTFIENNLEYSGPIPVSGNPG